MKATAQALRDKTYRTYRRIWIKVDKKTIRKKTAEFRPNVITLGVEDLIKLNHKISRFEIIITKN